MKKIPNFYLWEVGFSGRLLENSVVKTFSLSLEIMS